MEDSAEIRLELRALWKRLEALEERLQQFDGDMERLLTGMTDRLDTQLELIKTIGNDYLELNAHVKAYARHLLSLDKHLFPDKYGGDEDSLEALMKPPDKLIQ